MNVIDYPQIIDGNIHADYRGVLKYFNEFDLESVKRFYIAEHPDTDVVRAWQAHQKEKKWFHVIDGSFKVVLVRIDDWTTPSKKLKCEEIRLDSEKNQVLNIPGGYASGFQALSPNSKLMIFSDFTLEESLKDDFRFPKDLWYNW